MPKKTQVKLTEVVSVAFETNGRGYLGFIVELPGAYIRGRTEKEAIAKVNQEIHSYLRWLSVRYKHDYKIQIVQRHRSPLTVEDADSEILLEADKAVMEMEEFRNLVDLVWFSGETFVQLYTGAAFKDWVDASRIRKTFYGDNPKTIREIFRHVKNCQYYYLSRMNIIEKTEGDFLTIRKSCLEKLEALYRKSNNCVILEVDNELWTLKKALRRFIWHDRIHGKAMARILEKQSQLEMIAEYEDTFHFFFNMG